MNQKYWNGLEEYKSDAQFLEERKKEFTTELPIEEEFSEEKLGLKSNRRDFLKLFGFGVSAVTLAACVETPLKKAIPYINKPDDIVPGVPNWYASTCQVDGSNCSIIIKTREGRPIKIEGNPEAKGFTEGGTSAITQASVLSLYDEDRLKVPKIGSKETSWEEVDEKLKSLFNNLGSKKLRILTGTVTSPSTHKAIQKLLAKANDGKHITYDTLSASAIIEAHKKQFNIPHLPSYNFADADTIVSFNADFLGTWISPVEFTKAYTKNRKLNAENPKMSKHIQLESRLSLTGSNADLRVPLKPSQEGLAIASLYKKIKRAVNGQAAHDATDFNGPGNAVKLAADHLLKNKGKSLVVCGTNDVTTQEVVVEINKLLGNYGKTVDITKPSYQKQGNDKEVVALVNELNKDKNTVVILWGANPVYNYPDANTFAKGLKNASEVIQITNKEDETSQYAKYIIPDTHYMESWWDANPKAGFYSMGQPVIKPLYQTRSAQNSFLTWAGETQTFYELIQEHWRNTLFPKQNTYLSPNEFWNAVVQKGVFTVEEEVKTIEDSSIEPDSGEEDRVEATAIGGLTNQVETLISKSKAAGDGLELVVYPKVSINDGTHANNPWLQEMPDPITKVTWDNYISLPYKYAQQKGIQDGDLMVLEVNGSKIELPALVQPGQAMGTVAVALGYGRTKAGKVADNIGKNAFPMVKFNGETFSYSSGKASLKSAGGNYKLAKTQKFVGYEQEGKGGILSRKSIENRLDTYIVKETTLSEYKESRIAGNKRPSNDHMISLWDTHDKQGHHWGMAIDLNACTGCGNCIVSCHAENNVPVVGKEEVYKSRDMHWMRIDRYFRGDPADQDGKLEVTHQPMMCQHCDNAPCETVCPVLATVHSDEGLNQQVYNRCIGTRYCANNCPYKVRRFNWFSYYSNEDFRDVNGHMFEDNKTGNLVLNPDVTVRARGVMEKCSFCVQRIQEKKLKAKVENRKVQDGEVKTACQQSCPADAIVFGDLNDRNSEIWKLYNNKRAYHALEEVKTLPSVAYLTKVRNKPANEEKEG